MDKDAIVKKIYSKINEIPTLSPSLQKILSLVEDQKAGAAELTDVISRDPSLTSKILKVANSAYYGFSREIDTLDRAVVLLGFNMIRTLAMSIGIMKSITSESASKHYSQEGLWIHSLAVATVMKEIAMNRNREGESEAIFVTGLLHDIGKAVLDQFFPEEFHKALEEAEGMESSVLCETEKKYLGMDHGEVGSILLKRWKFPDAIQNPIEAHHKDTIPDGTDASVVAMIRVGNVLVQQGGLGMGSIKPHEISDYELSLLNLKEKDLEELREFLAGAADGIHAFFSAAN